MLFRSRQTTGATKALTYAKLARIVDGSDGLTYIAEYSFYGHINIMRGDMKFSQKIHATLGRWNCSPSSPSHSDRPQDSDHTSPVNLNHPERKS